MEVTKWKGDKMGGGDMVVKENPCKLIAIFQNDKNT